MGKRCYDSSELNDFKDEMNRMFDDYFDVNASKRDRSKYIPPVDVYETDENVFIYMELCGACEDNINVKIDQNNLIIFGEKKLKEIQGHIVHHRIEIRNGKFSRTITIPCSVDFKSLEKSFSNGVFVIELKKISENK